MLGAVEHSACGFIGKTRITLCIKKHQAISQGIEHILQQAFLGRQAQEEMPQLIGLQMLQTVHNFIKRVAFHGHKVLKLDVQLAELSRHLQSEYVFVIKLTLQNNAICHSLRGGGVR